MRRFPIHYDFFLKIATNAKLSCPSGRALYMCNRIQMAGWGCLGYTPTYNPRRCRARALRMMKRMLPDTGIRWKKHWEADGSIRCIRRSRLEEIENVKKQKARLAESRARWQATYGDQPGPHPDLEA